MQIIKLAKQEWRYLVALALLCAGLFFFELGRLPLLGPDEPRYAEVAREMYVSGDWITPRLGGLHWFEKPALLYWMVAASYRVLGVSEWTTRWSVALVASLGALILFFFGLRVNSARFGYLSAAALLTSALWLGFGRAAVFDIPLSVAIELALCAFFIWEREQRSPTPDAESQNNSNHAWWICCFALGLAVLAKGIVGILLPAAIIGLYLLLTRSLLLVLTRPKLLLLGALIFIVTASVWYGPMIARHDGEFIQEFFIAHHFQRFFSNKYHHPQPFYFFFAIALLGSFPWSLHLAAGAWQAAKQWRQLLTAPAERLRLFLWLWVLLPVIFFSFSGSKLPGYILPIFPGVAMLIALELENWWFKPPPRTKPTTEEGQKEWQEQADRWQQMMLRMARFGLGTALLLLIAAVAIGLRGAQSLNVRQSAVWAVVAIIIVVTVGYCRILGQPGWLRPYRTLWLQFSSGILVIPNGGTATLFLPFGLMLMAITSIHYLLPGLGPIESMRDLSLTSARVARPGERLAFYINNEQSINFYAPHLPLRDARAELVTTMSPAEIAALLEVQNTPSLLVISLERWSYDVISDEWLDAEVLAKQERPGAGRNLILLRVRLRKNVSGR